MKKNLNRHTFIYIDIYIREGFPGDPGEAGSIPGSGRSLEVGNGNPRQYSFLENPLDRGVWEAILYIVREDLETNS